MRAEEIETLESGDGQEDGVEVAALEAREAGADVAAHLQDLEVGTTGTELGAPPQAGGAHAGPVRQGVEARIALRDQGILRVFTRQDGRYAKPRRHLDGDVFQGVHREVRAPLD